VLQGNELFDLPKPVVPNAFEMYDAVHTENVTHHQDHQENSSYTIVPQFKGIIQ
jgi:hypothetical protein